MKDTDRDWEELAKNNPYNAVVTNDNFLNENLTAERREDFFTGGQGLVARFHARLRHHWGAPDRFAAALDFGCGVGRLAIPVGRVSDRVYGVDVAPSMLAECRRNIAPDDRDRYTLLTTDEFERRDPLGVQLVTSYIVLQHIPVRRGMELARHVLRHLSPGGFGVLHYAIAERIGHLPKEEGPTTGTRFGFYQRVEDHLLRLVDSAAPDELGMQMNHYNLNAVVCQLYDAGVRDLVVELIDDAGYMSAVCYFKKSA